MGQENKTVDIVLCQQRTEYLIQANVLLCLQRESFSYIKRAHHAMKHDYISGDQIFEEQNFKRKFRFSFSLFRYKNRNQSTLIRPIRGV